MDWVCYIILFALLCLGFLLTLLTLPGNWLMILATALYAQVTSWHILGWRSTAVLVALGIAGELVDMLAGSPRARESARARRTLGGIVGSVIGAIFLSMWCPMVGTIAGAVVGLLLGAWLFEICGAAPASNALASDTRAGHGPFVGMLLKIGFAGVIFLIGTFVGFPARRPGM